MLRMSGLPSRNYQSGGLEFSAAQTSYIEVLVGVDLGILDNVVGRFNRGDFIQDGQNEQWFPSPAAIMFQCKKVIQNLADDRARDRLKAQSIIGDVPTNRPTPEAKARMAALWEKTKAENAAADPDKKDNTPDAAMGRLEALAASQGNSVDWSKIKDQNDPTGWKRGR